MNFFILFYFMKIYEDDDVPMMKQIVMLSMFDYYDYYLIDVERNLLVDYF